MKKRAADILFGGLGPLSKEETIKLCESVSKAYKSGLPLGLAYRAIRYAINEKDPDTIAPKKIAQYIGKWSKSNKRDVKAFILSELEELVDLATVVKLTLIDIKRMDQNRSTKELIKENSSQLKIALKKEALRQYETLEDFGLDHGAGKIAIFRFFNEPRIPSKKKLLKIFDVLEIDKIEFDRFIEND